MDINSLLSAILLAKSLHAPLKRFPITTMPGLFSLSIVRMPSEKDLHSYALP